MSRCTGSGREHSQAASPSWAMDIFHTIAVMFNLWMEANWGQESALFWEFCLVPWVWWVLQNLRVRRNPWNLWVLGNRWVLGSLLGDRLRSWSLGSEKNCIMYSLFCIFIIIVVIIISSSTSSSISFIVLLNCLYLNPRVLLFHPFSSPSHQGREERVSVCVVLVAGCWVKLQHVNLSWLSTPCGNYPSHCFRQVTNQSVSSMWASKLSSSVTYKVFRMDNLHFPWKQNHVISISSTTYRSMTDFVCEKQNVISIIFAKDNQILKLKNWD